MYKRISVILLCLVFGFMVFVTIVIAAQDTENTLNSPQSSQDAPVTILNQVGGAVQGVTVSGTHAYVSRGPRLQVYDLSEAKEPVLVGQTAVLPRVLGYSDIDGYFVYSGLGKNIAVIDVSNPQLPAFTQIISTTGDVGNVKVQGNYLYAVQNNAGVESGVYVYERSGTGTISKTAFLPLDGYYFDFAIHGIYLYVTGDKFSNGFLKVISISDPENPVEVKSINRFEYMDNQTGVTVDGNYLYTGIYGSGGYALAIYDITDPESPSYIKSHSGSFHVRAVEVIGGFAYVAGSSGGFQLIDVSNVNAPFAVDDYKADTLDVVFAVDVAKKNDAVYLAYENMGFHVLDVSQSNAVTAAMVANETGYASGIAQVGSKLYVADRSDGFKIFNGIGTPSLSLENSSNPGFATLSSLSFADNEVFAEAGASYYSSSLAKFSVTDVLTPVVEGVYTPDEHIDGYVIDNKIAYLAEDDDGLENIDYSVSPPVKIGEWITGTSSVYDVAKQGNYAYLADHQNGLKIVDVSNPAKPSQVGFFDLEWIRSVEVYGDYAYAVLSESGSGTGDILSVIDISNPISPTFVVSLSHTTKLQSPTIKSDRLFMWSWDDDTGESRGLLAYDLSDPALPTLMFDVDIPGWMTQVETLGPYIYVASSYGGVVVLGPDIEYDEHVYLPLIVK